MKPMATDVLDKLTEIEAALIALDPNELDQPDATLQERKSAQTRTRLLEACVSCLANFGYAKTSTQLVAQTAKVSRGTMLHHYPMRIALIGAAIDFIELRRLRQFHDEIRKLTERERVLEGQGLEIYWRLMNTPESEAFLELTLARRTDAQLRRIFDQKTARYDKVRTQLLPVAFPEWSMASAEDFQLARDLITTTLTGLSLNHQAHDHKKRRIALRRFLFEAIQSLRQSDD
ncbi:MAG: TetR/AcrR family transcriptional regulator [Pseudomonadota bacterium]